MSTTETTTTETTTEATTIHGIDLTAPGGLEALFAFHSRTFGTATMSIAPDAVTTTDPIEPAEDLTTDVTGQVVDTSTDPAEVEEEGKTFDLAYVKKLRKEAATYRERAGKVDELGARLHAALVKEAGRLQDPTDLAYDPVHLEDPDALAAAIDALLTSKPHLASRRPQGTIPQGATREGGAGMTLGGLLRSNAG